MKQVGWTLKGALPGQDCRRGTTGESESRSERAHEEEQAALGAAQRAHDLATRRTT